MSSVSLSCALRGPAGKHLVSSSTRGSSCASPASPLGYNAVFLRTHCWESNRHVQIHCDDIPCAVTVALLTEDSEGSLWVGWLHTSRDTHCLPTTQSQQQPLLPTTRHMQGFMPSQARSLPKWLFVLFTDSLLYDWLVLLFLLGSVCRSQGSGTVNP